MLTFTHHDVVLIRKGTDEGVGQLREKEKRRGGQKEVGGHEPRCNRRAFPSSASER